MSIRQKSPGKWIIDYFPEGRNGPRVRRVVEGTEAQARDVEMQCRRMAAGKRVCGTNPTIQDALPDYLAWHKLHRAVTTHRDLLYCIKWMMPHFGHLPVSMITPITITRYQTERAATPRACNKEIHYLQGMITWMVKNALCEPLGYKPDQLPYHRPLPQPPPPGAAEQVLSYITDPIKKALVLVLYESGCRWSEAASLRWQDIDFELGKFCVVGKGSRQRICMLSDRCREILEPIRQESGQVFINPRTGKAYGSLKNILINASDKCGLQHMTPHKLRHAFATDLLTATGNMRLVQTALGHKDIATTTIYAQVVAGGLEQGAIDLGDYRRAVSEANKKRKNK